MRSTALAASPSVELRQLAEVAYAPNIIRQRMLASWMSLEAPWSCRRRLPWTDSLTAEPRQILFALLAVFGAQAAAAQTAPMVAPADALATYVAKPDDAFEWHVQRRYTDTNASVVELHLQSQRWQGQPWKHQLLVIRPKRVDDDDRALFVIGGGRWRPEYDTETGDEPLPEDGEIFVAMARVLHTNVVVLGQVPYQPLFDLTE